jgi:hypothetical protein
MALGREPAGAPAAPAPPPLTEERVREIARETMREELMRLVQAPAPAEPAKP